jgi:hypothetical protein
MIEKKDYPKAITWMAFFNVRDEFPLENVIF